VDDGYSVEVIKVGDDPRLEFILGCDANAAEHRSAHFGEEALHQIEPGSMLGSEYEGGTAIQLGGKPRLCFLGDLHGVVTLGEETAKPPAASLAEQQARLEAWRQDYNTNRPHEALGQRCPATLWQPSPRPFPAVIREWDYPPDHHLRRVNSSGYIEWRDQRLYLRWRALPSQHRVYEHCTTHVRAPIC
jgi:hypothetical protein